MGGGIRSTAKIMPSSNERLVVVNSLEPKILTIIRLELCFLENNLLQVLVKNSKIQIGPLLDVERDLIPVFQDCSRNAID